MTLAPVNPSGEPAWPGLPRPPARPGSAPAAAPPRPRSALPLPPPSPRTPLPAHTHPSLPQDVFSLMGIYPAMGRWGGGEAPGKGP
jgi:hypothetical protein